MNKQVGALLKQARHMYAESIGMKVTQTQFAELLGISRGYLADMETDRTEPSLAILSRVSELVGISLEFFQTTDRGRIKVAVYSGIRSVSDFELSDRIVGYIDLPTRWKAEDYVGMIAPDDQLAGLGVHAGDIVIVYKSNDVVDGSISLIVLNGGAPMLRRVHTQGQFITLSTIAANPAAPSIVDPSQTAMTVIGRAVKAVINL
jgi:transcriptional regulator with XRE-family HTH domain